MEKFDGLNGAIEAIDRLNQATQKQQNSKDKHGVMNDHLKIVDGTGGA